MLGFAGDGFFALKKVLIQNNEQLDLVKQEIHVSSYFKHPNLLPLLDHAIIPVKVTPDYKELPPLTSSSPFCNRPEHDANSLVVKPDGFERKQ
jgi:hypothetical protein